MPNGSSSATVRLGMSGLLLLLYALLALWALEVIVPLVVIAAAYVTRRARRNTASP